MFKYNFRTKQNLKILISKDHASSIEKIRKNLEQQISDLQVRLDQAENNALKGGKRIIQKLEQRVNKDIRIIFLGKINNVYQIIDCRNWKWKRFRN